MTIDEHIAQLQHVVAAHVEQAKKDYAENRRLWREQQDEVRAVWLDTDRRFAETDRRFAETDRRFRETDTMLRRHAAESQDREQRLDTRIGELVSSIGELCRRLDAAIEHKSNGKQS